MIVLQTHAHTAGTKHLTHLLYPQTGQVMTGMQKSQVAAVMPTTEKMKEMEWEKIIEEKDVGELTYQELRLQKDEEEYSIYIAGISEEEKSNIETDLEESSYFF